MKHIRARLLRAVVLAAAGRCSVCGGWFEGWDGGVCDACQATGRH